MTEARRRLGRRGEDAVAADLRRRGWLVVARNVRVGGIRGELDIVALEAGDLVFVEVKTLRTGNLAGPATPLEAVGPRKRAQLRKLAGAWLRANRAILPGFEGVRIDVVGLRLTPDGAVEFWEHVRAAC